MRFRCQQESTRSGYPAAKRENNSSKVGSSLAMAAWILILGLGLLGCGRSPLPEPSASTEASQSATVVQETQTPTPEATPGESAVPDPTPEASLETEPADEFADDFAAGDFKVPAGSAISREEWIPFLRKSLHDRLSSYSGAVGFMEAYRFSAETGAGSGEFQISCHVGIAWFSPGNRAEDFDRSSESLGVVMVVLEQGQSLKLLNLESEFMDADMPPHVGKALKTAYADWIESWWSMSAKEPAAIPGGLPMVASTAVGNLTGDFLPPAQGETTADLDGDGKDERVQVLFREDDARWEIHVGEAVASDWYDYPEGAYLVDLDKGDQRLEVAITDRGPSDDALTHLYSYANGGLFHVGTVSGILFASDGKGRVSTYSRSFMGPMNTWFFQCEYQLDETGRLAMIPTRWYASSLELTLKQDLPLYAGPDDDAAGSVMKAGTAVLMDLSDIASRFHILAADGTEGWLWYQDGENLMLPDGRVIGQTDALDGIISAD